MCCPQLPKEMPLFTCSNCGQISQLLHVVPGSVSWWCVTPAGRAQNSILPEGRAVETSPSPGVFSAGEVCCLLSAKECLCFCVSGDSYPDFCHCDTAQESTQLQLQLGHVSFQPFWLQVERGTQWLEAPVRHWGLRTRLHLPFLWSLWVLCV